MKKFLLLTNLITLPICYVPSYSLQTDVLYVAVPSSFEVIEKRWDDKYVFKGLKDQTIIPSIDGYNAITLISKINVLSLLAKQYGDNRLDAIIKIDCESNSNLEEISPGSISGLSNLEQIVFSNSIKEIGKCAIINCPKLNILDFSSFNEDKYFISPYILDISCPEHISKTGIVYVSNSKIKSLVETKFHSIDIFKQWSIEIK